ncbi:MAG: hypothetical protein PHG05_04265 [Candidatus Nanoarchaeia archaeon]|nr:hypothetical protein [Candidatus Nanoarchaeia archaeon]
MIIGIIGLILLGIGWIPETIKIIKERKASIDWKFGVLYVVGSLLLVVYSVQIRDYVFLILNSFVALMSGISLFFSVRKRL